MNQLAIFEPASRTLAAVYESPANVPVAKDQFESCFLAAQVLNPGEHLPKWEVQTDSRFASAIKQAASRCRFFKSMPDDRRGLSLAIAHYVSAVFPWRQGSSHKVEGGVTVMKELAACEGDEFQQVARMILRGACVYRRAVDMDSRSNARQYVMRLDNWVRSKSYLESMPECNTAVEAKTEMMERLK